MRRKPLNTAQAQNLLDQYHASNLSRAAFRQKHGVSLSLFAYWLPRLRARKAPVKPSFQEVRMPPMPHGQCILTLTSGARLEFPASHLSFALTLLAGEKAPC